MEISAMPRIPRGRPLIIAHRGFSARYLENTLAAFQEALDMGADMVELDLQLTRDRRLVVLHDATTARVSREKVRVRRTELSRLREVDLEGGHRIPTLEEVLDLVGGRVPLNLELKAKGTGAALARFLLKRKGTLSLLVSSYKAREVGEFHRLCPSIPVARIYTRISVEDLARDARKGHYSVHVDHRYLREKTVKTAHSLGLKVFTFTVDDPREMLKFFAWGVDGIFTNDPATALKVARDHGYR